MAPKTRKALVRETLQNLRKAKFEAFVEALLDRREEPRVKCTDVEDQGFLKVTNVVVSTFTEQKAPQVVAEILREIGCGEEAEKLVAETGGQSSNPGSSDAAGPSPGATAGNTMAEGGCTNNEHFVDKHKLELIRRVTNIAAILDELLVKKVIDDEKWEEIRKMPTPNAKVREVYICMRAGDECKNIFFEILKRQEKFLIEDLQKKN
ncbi:uncharacterized protein LOC130171586 isoform X1 [Seriola aureovittata]|uniref:uncharacterized protein LOC130171586 isoform X1 n=1 Tax=Seriola aureovittata TaxID=2871759 RepID=UPI0024BF0606|nr:uncharacterized protein LOC130171586 isoform X1 [Seriola aureovittata]